MDDGLAAFFVMVGITLLVLPVLGVGLAWNARKRAALVQRALDETRAHVDAMAWRLVALERRLASVSSAAEPASPPVPPEPQPPIEAQPPVQEESAPAQAPPPPEPPPPQAYPAAPPPSAPAAVPPASFDWEGLIGVRFFAWLGGAALFIGAALFLQYSIQHNLIPPEIRVAIGLVVGALALAGGDYLRTKADRMGQALAGSGVAILYASLFAARSLYQLLDTIPTFASMAAVTVVAGVMAVRRGAYILAILGLLGGMATPYLLSTGEDRPVALLAYVTLLDAGVLVVARKRRWPSLGLLGLVGSAAIYLGWALHFLDRAKLPYALVAAGALAALFAFTKLDGAAETPEGAPRRTGLLSRSTALAAGAAPLVLALIVAGSEHLAVAPAVLVPYLLVVSAGAWITSRQTGAPPLLLLAAGLSSIALVVRVDDDLFPAHRAATLFLFALVPAAFFVLWVLRRRTPEAGIARLSAAVTLGASLLVVFRVVSIEGAGESIALPCVFGAMHVVGLASMGVVEGTGVLIASAQALSVATLLVLLPRYSPTRFVEFLPAVVLPMVGFWALPGLGPKFARDRTMWLSSAAAFVVHFAILYVVAQPVWGDVPLGATAIACAVGSLLMLRHCRAVLPADSGDRLVLSAAFGAVTLLFVTASIPILVSNEWLTVAWGLEAAALAWLLRRVPHRGLLYASGALAAATFVRLVCNPVVWEYHPRTATPILNFYLYTFGVPALSFFAGAYWLEGQHVVRAVRGLPLAPLLRAGALVLLFVLMNVEVADYYSTGSSITFRFSGGGLAQDMTYSLAWGIFAIAVFAFGIARKRKPPRIGALGVLLLTIGKVFLHDLWELGALYRVGSIVGLAVALLAVSFLTQHFVLRAESP